MELFEFTGDKDMANLRTVVLDDKAKTEVKLERYDPYGLVRLVWPNGKAPEKLADHNYTSFEEARKALEAYNTQMKNK